MNTVAFVCPATGVTTSGSSYPRSELREMNGSNLASWSNKAGYHRMEVHEAFMHLPTKKPEVVGGQIHDADDDIIEVYIIPLQSDHQ